MFINLSCWSVPISLVPRSVHRSTSRMHASALDGAGSNHLPLQVLLVLADAAVPAGDGLVLAHHDVLGDLVEESGKKDVSKFALDFVCVREFEKHT